MTRADVVARIKPPAIALILLVAGAALHFLFPDTRLIGPSYGIVGIGASVVGLALMLWAVQQFDKKATTRSTQEKPTALVTAGPLAYSRNPMYLGVTLLLLGLAVVVATVPMFAVPIGFWATMNWVFVPHEEKVLEQLLGAEYLDYKRRVRRWL